MALGSFGSSFMGGFAGAASVQIVIRAVDQFSAEFKKAETSMAKLGKASKVAALGVAGAFALMAREAGKFEQTQIAFKTLIGDTQKAEKFLKKLTDFAKKTPFTLPGVEKAARQLLAVGFEAEEVLPVLKDLGDVSAGLGMGEEGLQRLILNLGQVKNQGKLTGRELRDFAVNGVPLLDELSKQLGVTTAEIQDMTSRGEIGADAVLKAFKTMSSEGGRFANLMDKQAESLNGQISNLIDSITILARDIGQELLPPIKSVVSWLSKMVAAFQELSPEMRGLISKGVVGAGAAVIGAGVVAKGVDIAKTLGLIKTANMNVQATNVNIAGGGTGTAGGIAGKIAGKGGGAGVGGALAGVGAGTIGAFAVGVAATGAQMALQQESLKKMYGEAAPKLGTYGLPTDPTTAMMMLGAGQLMGTSQEDMNEQQIQRVAGLEEESSLMDELIGKQEVKTEAEVLGSQATITSSQAIVQLAKDQYAFQLATEQLEKQYDAGKISGEKYVAEQEILNQKMADAKTKAEEVVPKIADFSTQLKILMDTLDRKSTTEEKAAFLATMGSSIISGATTEARARLAEKYGPERAGGGFSAQSMGRILSRGHTYSGFTSSIPTMQHGGIVRSPTMALIGEAGPEAVVPLNSPRVGVGGINVNIGTIQGLDAENVAEALQERLQLLISA